MKIGAMNHPARDVVTEIQWMAEMGLEFVDLTLEPPAASAATLDVRAVRAALQRYGMSVVGHTAWYLPIANPFDDVRRSAVEELRRCLRVFAEVGAAWMNVHPDTRAPLHGREFVVASNRRSLAELLPEAAQLGVGVMVENLPGWGFNTAEEMADLLDPFAELGLHLDIGHCNLRPGNSSTAEPILRRHGARLRHVHLHDNKGGDADLHLPLGAGTVDVPGAVGALQRAGYDGTITLEVFSPDRHYLAHSAELLRRVWAGAPAGIESVTAPH